MTLQELKNKLEDNENTYGGYYYLDSRLSAIEDSEHDVEAGFVYLYQLIGFLSGLSCCGYISEQEEHDLRCELLTLVDNSSERLHELLREEYL